MMLIDPVGRGCVNIVRNRGLINIFAEVCWWFYTELLPRTIRCHDWRCLIVIILHIIIENYYCVCQYIAYVASIHEFAWKFNRNIMDEIPISALYFRENVWVANVLENLQWTNDSSYTSNESFNRSCFHPIVCHIFIAMDTVIWNLANGNPMLVSPDRFVVCSSYWSGYFRLIEYSEWYFLPRRTNTNGSVWVRRNLIHMVRAASFTTKYLVFHSIDRTDSIHRVVCLCPFVAFMVSNSNFDMKIGNMKLWWLLI